MIKYVRIIPLHLKRYPIQMR